MSQLFQETSWFPKAPAPSPETSGKSFLVTKKATMAIVPRDYSSAFQRDVAIGPGEEEVLDAEAATDIFDDVEVIPDVTPEAIPDVTPDVIPEGPNYMLWGGIGVGVLALLTIYFVARK